MLFTLYSLIGHVKLHKELCTKNVKHIKVIFSDRNYENHNVMSYLPYWELFDIQIFSA